MYREPGVYLKIQKLGILNPNAGAMRIPVIMGTGPSVLRKTITMTRANSGQVDTLPVNATVLEIVGDTSGVSKYAVTTDYTFNAATSPNQITWVASKGPTPGATYYVTCQYKVDATTQYEPQLCLNSEDVDTYFGPDLKVDAPTTICKLSAGARFALKQGCPAVWVLQVKPATDGAAVTSTDYQTALDKYASFLESAWRIVPVDVDQAINGVIDGHINKLSSVEERLERTVVYGNASQTVLSTAANVETTVGGYAASKANARIVVFYPDTATAVLSDGKTYNVDAGIIGSAFAGMEARLNPQTSRTRSGIVGFDKLGGVKMRRTEMNNVAAKGVTILTQSVAGADIIVRHGISTDMSSVQNREISITDISDVTSKTLRNGCEAYIGKYNITPDVITRINGTINAIFAKLKEDGVILNGTILELMQDENNPDSLVVKVRVEVPYPCNYIDITVALA